MTAAGLAQLGLPDALRNLSLEDPAVQWAVAIAVLVVGYYLSGLVVRLIGRRAARRFRRPSVTRAVLRSTRLAIAFLAFVIALSVLGLQLGDIVLSVTVFSAVLGIVLAPIIGSVISGLFVLADQPYEIGDLVELSDRDQRGYVEDVTLRYTKIFTLDNTFLVIPNSTIRERDVVNYSAEDERVRLRQRLLVTYESDVEAARSVMERAARETDAVIEGGPDIRIGSARYPARPTCYVADYADHGVALELRYWLRDPSHIQRARSAVNDRIWAGLDDVDVTIAYPHAHLVFDETSGQLSVGLDDPAEE